MASPTTRTPPSSATPSAQPSSRPRDWSKLRNGEPGSAFVASRGRGARGGSRGGARGGRGGGRPPSSPAIRDGKLPHPEPSESHGSQPDISTPKAEPPSARKGLAQSVPSSTSGKPPFSSADRAPKPKTPTRRTSRSVPTLTVAPASPTPDSVQNAPSTPSRNLNKRRRSQPHTKPPPNGTTKSSIPPSTSLRPQKPGAVSTSSVIAPRKDVPPHLVAAHEAEIRNGIDALVEHVRAVAMAENRPSTPGSHIDWAGDEDDSLPDLDDWGVTTTNTSTGDKEEEISPILADALRPLPEPQTEGDAEDEEEQHVEPLDNDDEDDGGINQNSSEPSPLSNAPDVQDTSVAATADAHETPIVIASETIMQVENPNPSSAEPLAAMENHRADLPPKPAPVPSGEATKKEGLSQSIHAPSPAKGEAVERTLSSSSSEFGLGASIHAPKNLPESHSAPSLLNSGAPSSAHTFSPLHGRSKTEGRGAFPHPRTAPATASNQRAVRSGMSSPLGPHALTHGRNHSTPPGATGQRVPHARPVITGEAISRLARTIGGMPVMPRAQGVAVAKD
ncbi:hypothetical protein AZE42_00966 [Rhizopogon vesiculosus]|uniref:Uncharacterized protein n=1 Tax=Rhizopogon vesiculosus TaxID=180088 RepID=A0A1J8QPB4_9AGAM|nr:hypothetical protein AZE42_00966 [Rhizopogon vesiculosus]